MIEKEILEELAQYRGEFRSTEYSGLIRSKEGYKCPLAFLCKKRGHDIGNSHFESFKSILSISDKLITKFIHSADFRYNNLINTSQKTLRSKLLKSLNLPGEK